MKTCMLLFELNQIWLILESNQMGKWVKFQQLYEIFFSFLQFSVSYRLQIFTFLFHLQLLHMAFINCQSFLQSAKLLMSDGELDSLSYSDKQKELQHQNASGLDKMIYLYFYKNQMQNFRHRSSWTTFAWRGPEVSMPPHEESMATHSAVVNIWN